MDEVFTMVTPAAGLEDCVVDGMLSGACKMKLAGACVMSKLKTRNQSNADSLRSRSRSRSSGGQKYLPALIYAIECVQVNIDQVRRKSTVGYK